MTTRNRAVAVLLTSAAGLALLAGCGLRDYREDPPGGDGGKPAASSSFTPKAPLPSGRGLDADAHVPAPPKADESDATAVAEAWARIAYSHDTAYDTSPHDAALRAARFLTPRGAAALREYRPVSGPGDQWNTWAGHRAWTTVDVEADLDGDAPPDAPREAYRALFVKGEAHGRDGWRGEGPRVNVFLKLTRVGPGRPWQVADVTLVEAAAPPSASPSATAPDSNE
ncbi:hypothetical protein J3S85_10945 [Streptomyces lavenduligriseus]|nr:hypothetical protein J3S85_10945 [Streptomyces lavenduligriseus]